MGHTSTTVSWEKANSDASNYKEGGPVQPANPILKLLSGYVSLQVTFGQVDHKGTATFTALTVCYYFVCLKKDMISTLMFVCYQFILCSAIIPL